MRYSKEHAFKLLEDAQGMKIQVKIASKNPNFTLQDQNRPMFYNDKYAKNNPNKTKTQVIKELKQGWHDQHFGNDFVYAKFIENSVLTASIVLPKDKDITYEEYRNVNYVYAEVDGAKKYYFVTSMRFTPQDIIEYEVYLDSVTTYLDALTYNGQAKVERTHWDRLKNITGPYVTKDFTADLNFTPGDLTISHVSTAPNRILKKTINITNKSDSAIMMTDYNFTGKFVVNDGDHVISTSKDFFVLYTYRHLSNVPITYVANVAELAISNGKFDNGTNVRVVDFAQLGNDKDNSGKKARIKLELVNNSDSMHVYYDFSEFTADQVRTGLTELKVVNSLKLEGYEEHINGTILTHNTDGDSPVWNVDDTMNVFKKINTGIVKSEHLVRDTSTDRDEYLSYFTNFNIGDQKNPKFAYLLHAPKTGETAASNYVENSITSSGGLIVSVLIPLHNKDVDFTLDGVTFTNKNKLSYETISAVNSNGIIITDYPLEWDKDNIGELTGQKYIKTKNSYRITRSIIRMDNPFFETFNYGDHKLDDTRLMIYEPKMKSEEYLNLKLYSSTDQDIDLFNFKVNTWSRKLEIQPSVIATETKTMNIYDLNSVYASETPNQIKDKELFFITTNFEQLPTVSEPYKNYMNQHMSSYQTGITANKVQGGLNIASSILSFNPMKIANAATNFAFKEKQYKAQVEDLKRQGNRPLGTGTSLSRDIVMQNRMNLNYGLGLMIYEPPMTMKQTIFDHFYKYGYIVDRLMSFNGYEDFARRYRFTHWEISNFSNAVDKTNISNEILQDIASVFDAGVTLWSVRNANGDTEINDYSKENWENFIAENIS